MEGESTGMREESEGVLVGVAVRHSNYGRSASFVSDGSTTLKPARGMQLAARRSPEDETTVRECQWDSSESTN